MTVSERPSAALRARFLQAAARVPSTPPSAWLRRAALSGVGAAAWWVLALLALGPRFDWHELPAGALLQTLATLLAVGLLAMVAGLTRGRAMVGAAAEPLALATAGLPTVLLFLVFTVDPRGPSTMAFTGWTATLWHARACDILTSIIALPLLGMGLLVPRGLTLSRPQTMGACLGLAAATFAHMVIRIHCPVSGAGHALLGHLMPALPLMLLGAWAGKRMNRRLHTVERNGQKRSPLA